MQKILSFVSLIVFLANFVACSRPRSVIPPPIDFVAEEQKVCAAIAFYGGLCGFQHLTIEFNPAILAHHLNWYMELKVPKDGSLNPMGWPSGQGFQQSGYLCTCAFQADDDFARQVRTKYLYIPWLTHLSSCLKLMQTFPSREYQHVLRKIIYSSEMPFILYREEALEALARTGDVTDELWHLLESPDWVEPSAGQFHQAIVKHLAYDLALKSDEAGLQCLIEEVLQKQSDILEIMAMNEIERCVIPLLKTLIVQRTEPSFEKRLIYLFEFLVSPRGIITSDSNTPGCWSFYELKVFSELWFQNIEIGTQILDRYTQQKPQLRMDFLRLVKDLNIPFMMGTDEEAELYQRVGRIERKWLPLNMPGIPRLKTTPPVQNQQI